MMPNCKRADWIYPKNFGPVASPGRLGHIRNSYPQAGTEMATRRSPTARHRRLIGDLKRLREPQGLSREQVAERIGSSETSYFRHEKGRAPPQPGAVARMLDCDSADGGAATDGLLEAVPNPLQLRVLADL